MANRQLPSGNKKSHSNSSSDCGLDESEDEPVNDYEKLDTPYTNGHYRQIHQQRTTTSQVIIQTKSAQSPPQQQPPPSQQQIPQQQSSPLYAQVIKDRDSVKNDTTQHTTIPNTYRNLNDSAHGSYSNDLNSSYDSILGSNDKLTDSGTYSENWSSQNRGGRTKTFKMPFAEELNQVLAENKG